MAWKGAGRAVGAVLPLALLLALLQTRPATARSFGTFGLSQRQRAALTRAGFLRDSVESVPAHVVPGDGERGAHRSSLRSPAAAFGTRALPLRDAVERRPSSRDRARARYPLRDAVERRPPPDPRVAPPQTRAAQPVRPARPARPVVRTPSLDSGTAGWPHNVAHPFLAASGADWWRPRTAALPSPPYVIPVGAPVALHPQTWPQTYLSSFRTANPLLAQPQQRWGLISQPNYVFNTLGDKQQPHVLTYQSVKAPEPEHKIVCYLEAWSAYRKDVVAYSAHNLDPFACTHLLYAFASIDPHSFRVVPQDDEYDLIKGGYRAAVGLKRQNPNLKVMLSVGGWMEGSSKFSQMASRAERRREFIRSLVRILDEHKFDGVDLDWEYPGALDLGGLSADRDHFSLLVDELSEVFRPRGWLLSAAVSPSRFRMEDAYDVPRIAASLDFINLMAFDLHAERDSAADHHAPLHQRPHDASIDIFYNVDYAVKYWMKRGAPAEKLVLGVPFYGRSFTLKDPARHTPGSPIKGLGKEGRYTQEKGFLSYFEICELQAEGGWRQAVDRAGSPFMVKGDQWVGYEDAVSIANKMAYIQKQKLGGVMIWAVDLDDFQGLCGAKTPLLNAVRNNIDGAGPVYTPSTAGAPAKPSSSLVTVVVRGGEAQCMMGEFRSDPDCRKYYMCVHGELVAFNCAPGLQWNKKKNICDWPTDSDCKDETPEEVPAKPPGDSNGEYTTSKPVEKPAESETPSEPGKPDSNEAGTEVVGETDGSEWATWKPTTTTKNPWAWEPTIVTPAPVVDNDPLPELSGYYKIVCYFTNWAWYRTGQGKYLPEDINANLCTHIVYGFAVLDYESLVIKAHDSWADFDNKFYERVLELKKRGKKVTLAIGGWNDSAGDKYSRLVNSPGARRRFIKHLLDFLDRYGFDGLDLDWEYPKCWQVNCDKGPDADKKAFGLFVREIRKAFDVQKRKLLLSAAVSPSKTVIDAGYDVAALAESLDWVAVMTYDYHGQWDKKTGHVAPMFFHPDDDFYFFNSNYSINYWIQQGVPRRKVVMGMPLYGQSFQLAEASTNGLNAKAPGPGTAGEYTRAAGFLAYYEICDRIKNRGWTVVKDPMNRMGPYAFHDNQWVSFDDVDMIKFKSQYIRHMDLGGGMIWALDLDDFRNTCGEGRHPLLKTIRRVLGPAKGAAGVENYIEPPTTAKPAAEKPEVSPVVAETDSEPESSPPKPEEEPQKKPESESESESGASGVDSEGISVARPDDFKVVCYFTNWAWYRQDLGKYLPSDIDPSLCTHIVYGFAVLDGETLTIKPHDSWADIDNNFYEKVTALKKKGVKVTVAIGGWNDSAGDKYSRLANSESARARFVRTVVEFIKKWNFDGLDLDWEYPKCWQVNCKLGPDSDKQGFAALVKALRAAFQPDGLLLSSAVSPNKAVIDAGYDVPTLSRDLDWIAVMAYDYHGQWDKKTGHVAPMFVHPSDSDATFNTNFTINYWISQGADKKKLVLGMPMYGQSFSLADNKNNGLNAPTYGGGEAGDFTRARGFLSYYEICFRVQRKGWTVVRDPAGAMGPYAYKGDQWVSFDDIDMIRFKSEWARDMGLGGGMIWALDLDDFTNRCHCEAYPLLRTINRVLRGYAKPDPKCTLEKEHKHDGDGDTNVVESVGEAGEVVPEGVDEAVTVDSAGESAGKECDAQTTSFAAHESDCNKYYTCQHGSLLLLSCPPGLHWNAKAGICDWPENAKCKPGTGPDNIPTTTTEPPTDTATPPAVIPVMPPMPPSEVQKPAGSGEYKVVCYFTNWAWYRQGVGKYTPEDIDGDLCTHITYGFAVLDGSTLTIKPHDSWADIDNDFYQKVVAYKKKGIKVLIAIGGWNDSLGDKYSRLVNDPEARRRFVANLVQFVEKYNFDGLDLDWEYPKCWQVNCNLGPDSDKEGFAALVTEISEEFKPRGWLLSAAVSPSKTVIDEGYDVPTLSRHFDWIAVMTYDFHGHWDKQTGHVAPLYELPGDTFTYFNANYTMHYWIEKGADRKKLVMGMPMYGQSFALADTNDRGLNAKAYGPGEAGEFTRAGGFLAYYEICDAVKRRDWKVVRDPQGRIGPYAYRGNQWVSYDDVDDIRRKSKFVKELGLGGGMIWALDLDDFSNRCGCGHHPLLKTINQELRGLAYSTVNCT